MSVSSIPSASGHTDGGQGLEVREKRRSLIPSSSQELMLAQPRLGMLDRGARLTSKICTKMVLVKSQASLTLRTRRGGYAIWRYAAILNLFAFKVVRTSAIRSCRFPRTVRVVG